METLFTIHEITIREGGEPMFAALPADGSNGLVIGDLSEVAALRDRLDAFLVTKQADGEIDAWDDRLGHEWMSVREASSESGVPGVTISWACRNGYIRGAVKKHSWRFPRAQFVAWLHNRPSPGPKAKTA